MRTAALILVLLAAAAPALAQRQLIGTTQDHSFADATDCQNFHTNTLTSFPARVQEQEQRDVPLAGIDLLKVRASQEGGISIRGWDKPHARMMVCKYAVAQTKRQAKKALDGITVSYANGHIAAQGPAVDPTQVWWVNIILYVPKSATLDVASANGGIAIRNMNGKVTAHATNGGISVAQCAGEHKVSTENGGISLEKISGRIEAATQHGPIALKMAGTRANVEAKTDVEGEILCRLEGCSNFAWTADRKSLRIGTMPPSIRLSTESAPIMIDHER